MVAPDRMIVIAQKSEMPSFAHRLTVASVCGSRARLAVNGPGKRKTADRLSFYDALRSDEPKYCAKPIRDLPEGITEQARKAMVQAEKAKHLIFRRFLGENDGARTRDLRRDRPALLK
jgi:hypothetical protein